MNTEEIIDTVNVLEMLWNEGLFYHLSYEIKELYDTRKESYVHTVMTLFQQRVGK